MVELGVGMIAICLPTFRALVTEKSIKTVIHNVRSAISLHSISRRYSENGERSIRSQSSRKELKQSSEQIVESKEQSFENMREGGHQSSAYVVGGDV